MPLPESRIISVLKAKSEARTDSEFDYLAHLENLREHVSGEVRFINQLFPEYTPHDEEYHLKRLFFVADMILGPKQIERMNATELFVLACGLYAHDWGMAVNNYEREFIVEDVLNENVLEKDLSLIPKEKARFNAYQRKLGKPSPISDDSWREYVRLTHAERSGEKVRKFFETIEPGLGDAISRVCVGHWLDMSVLEDRRRYPLNHALLRENVNPASISIYVRIIDLFDIGRDRTPYVIWKFVAPRNQLSKLEWEKHRALNPVTIDESNGKRVLIIDGKTDDYEVYASLEDLRNYCETQLNEARNLLFRLNDSRHTLDIYSLNWRVEATGFEPVSVGFEFERQSVLKLLSGEVYDNDPYVFLRELIQNSIDAIRMRREILTREGVGAGPQGIIRISIKRLPDDHHLVTVSDNGIGMDMYTIRNYLAVAGRSYYRSTDFESLALKLDPISRFGIGILSCFVAGEKIEIVTRREPYFDDSSSALVVKIPAVDRSFRITTIDKDNISVGTSIAVSVVTSKFSSFYTHEDGIGITSYLRAIAGFVEFPILIDEEGRRTIIVHPNFDRRKIAEFSDATDAEVVSVELNWPWFKALVAQDVSNAQKAMKETCYDIAADLQVPGYEGRLSYLTLASASEALVYNDGVVECIDRSDNSTTFRYLDGWLRETGSATLPPPSARILERTAVFRDGILVPNAPDPVLLGRTTTGERSSSNYLVVNLKSIGCDTNLARTRFESDETHWARAIEDAFSKKILDGLADRISNLSLFEQYELIGNLVVQHRIHPEWLERYLPVAEWPVMMIGADGNIRLEKWGILSQQQITVFADEHASWSISQILMQSFWKDRNPSPIIEDWNGGECVINGLSHVTVPLYIRQMVLLANYALRRYCSIFGMNFFVHTGRSRRVYKLTTWNPGRQDDYSDEDLIQAIAHGRVSFIRKNWSAIHSLISRSPLRSRY